MPLKTADTELTVREIDTENGADVRNFIRLPFRLYRDNGCWVPPLLLDSKMQLNRKRNPFYLRNDASFFLALRNGRIVGRLAVFEPRYLNSFRGTRNAHFNLFECENDPEATRALFETASDWACERGLTALRGPFGFIAGDGFGLLAAGFALKPAPGMPYNFEYYVGLLENAGFSREERILSGYFNLRSGESAVPEKIERLSEIVRKRYGLTVKSFASVSELKRVVAPKMADLYNRTLTHLTGDPPLPPEEMEVIMNNLLLISDPKLHKFIMKDDGIVGFLFCFPDISNGLKKANGRLFPFGYFHIRREFRKTDRVDFNGMGIVPEYQGKAGTALLYSEIRKTLLEYPGYEHAEVIQISEFNPKSLNEMKRFGVDFNKEHWIFGKRL